MMLNNSIKRLLGVASFTMCALMLSPMASAIVLTPGSSSSVYDNFTGLFNGEGFITSGNLVGSMSSTFVGGNPNHIGGTYYSEVYKNDASNPGGLDFFYEVTNFNGVNDAISSMSANNYAGFITNVGIYTGTVNGVSSGTVAPTTVSRSSAALNNGDSVFATFGTPGNPLIMPGQASVFLVVQVNASAITQILEGVRDGNGLSPAGLSPSAAPEPASIVFFGSCLLGMAGFMRRRNSGIQLS